MCIRDRPYIFYYAIDSIELNDSAAKAVQQYAQATGLPVYVMFTGNKSYGLETVSYTHLDVYKRQVPGH